MSDDPRYIVVPPFQHRLLITEARQLSVCERIAALFNTGLRGAAFLAWVSRIR